MSNLPDCLWLSIAAHVVSDETGAAAAITLGGSEPKNIYETDWEPLIANACALLNDMGDCTDARPMTKDEVKKYQRNQSNDCDERG